MLISEYLALRNQISVTTGNTVVQPANGTAKDLSLIHISEPTRPY